ncbi:MAG: serine/threonine-protein kinase [Planctomycetota bacterium]|nr:serine/threonine-protein kinase [Planctomycetota bacterium]
MDEVKPHEPAGDSAGTTRQRAAEDLFDEIRVLPEEAREAAIEAGSDDPWVRAEVRSLLRFDGPTVATVGSTRAADFDAESCIGLSAGGFTLRRVIGVGGMGTVFEADQELPSRRIAVKVLHAATVRASALARFRKESDFLARLDHQNIARVISAGTLRIASDGGERPYFAMELVEDGRPITRWARDTDAGLKDVIRMMATACDAVGSGHRSGVVHLDLKPGNLLVSKSGALRVIDYGIARSVEDPEATGDTSFAGTPQYMAPEQCVRGAKIDSRADVYALGLILYELLARRLPYETRGTTWGQTTRLVRETVPPDLRRVDSTIPRELEAIVRRAMAKDPDARYGTASELGDDLRRWLDDEPVLALKPRAVDAALRAVRRNPLAATLATVATLAVVAGAAVSALFAVRASHAARLERISAARANAQAASSAVEEGEPAEAALQLDRVPEDQRGWESRHLAARIANFELYAVSPQEILSVDSLDATGEAIGGVTKGSLLIADRSGRRPPVHYDLRAAYGTPAEASVISVAGSADGLRIFIATNELDLLMLDRRDDTLTRIATGAMCVRPAGRLVACANHDGSVSLVDPDTARAVARSDAAGVEVIEASIAKNGRSALISLSDGSLRMLDIDPDAPSVRERWRTAAQTATSRAPAVSPDGSMILAAWRNERITRHDPATGAVIGESYLSGGSVFSLAISPDNRTAAASSWTRQLRLIDIATLAVTRQLGGSLTHVWGIDFTADGSRVIGRIVPLELDAKPNARDVELIGAWPVRSEIAVREHEVCGHTVAATPGPDAGIFTLVGADGGMWEFDSRAGTHRRIGSGPLRGARVARSREWIAVGDMDGVLHFYRLENGLAVESWKTQVFATPLAALAASPDGSLVLVGEQNRSLAAVSAADGRIMWKSEIPFDDCSSPPGRRWVAKILFLDGGRLVTYAGRLAGVPRAVFRTRDGALEPTQSIGGGGESDDAAFRRTDGWIYSLGVTGELHIGEPMRPDRTEQFGLNGGVLCLDAAETRLFVATRDGSTRVAGFEPTMSIARLEGPAGSPIAIAFDDDRDALTVVTNRGIARTWLGAPRADPARATPTGVAPDLRVPRLRDGLAAK